MATSSSANEIDSVQINEVLTCSICKGYSESKLVQFQCFHVCHRDCLKKSLRNTRLVSKFHCHECKAIYSLPQGGVDDFSDELLQNIVEEIATIMSSFSLPCIICTEVGEENSSRHYCITCQRHMCAIDTKRHKMQADHKIITNAEMQTEENLPNILSSKRAICHIHSTPYEDEGLKFYCQKCQIPICHICNGTDHKSHKSISIQEASKELKQEFKIKVTEIQDKKNQCEHVIEELLTLLNKTDNNSKQQKKECIIWGEGVKQVVDKIVNQKNENIENVTDIQKNEYIKILEEKKCQVKQFKSAIDYMKFPLKCSSDSDLLQKGKTFCGNLDTILEQEVPIDINTIYPEIKLKNVKDIEKSLEETIKVVSVNDNHKTSTPGLIGFELEAEWQTDDFKTGVAVYGEDVIMCAFEQKIEVYGVDGQRKGQIECPGLENAYDIAAVNKRLFVSDCHKNKRQILVIDRKGNGEGNIRLPSKEHGFDDPNVLCIAVDHTNLDIYISSAKTHTVYKCRLGQAKAKPFITTGLNCPLYLCVTPLHEVIVSNIGSHKVSKHNSEGTILWKYGREGELNFPQGVCVDPWDHVFVCDKKNHRILHLSPEGKFLTFVNIRFDFPRTITFKNKKIIVSCEKPNRIIVIKLQYEYR